MDSVNRYKELYRENLYKEAISTVKNNGYSSVINNLLEKDTDVSVGVKSIVKKYLAPEDMFSYAVNLYVNEKMNEAFPQDLYNVNNPDDSTRAFADKVLVNFLNDKQATNDYKEYMDNINLLSNDIRNQISSASENSFFKTNKGLDTENSYSGEKFQVIEGYSNSLENIIIQETDILNEKYKDDPFYQGMKDPFLSDVTSAFSEINNYMYKLNTESNDDLVENNLLDVSSVKVNTFGLENTNNTKYLDEVSKGGAKYIKKEWLSSDLYQNFEAVDMSDKYKYGSMDKNTQFSNAMKFAEIFGIDEEGQKSEQFKKDALLFNEIYYAGLELTDSFNLSLNFSPANDKIATSMAKDFFGEQFDNIVQYNDKEDLNMSVNRENLSQNIMMDTIKSTQYISNKDDFVNTLQETQKYITKTKYLDNNNNQKEYLKYLEDNLTSGTAEENRERLVQFNLLKEENELHRQELLKYFDILVQDLEKNGVIDEYVDYDKKDSLPSSVSPIFGKSIYA